MHSALPRLRSRGHIEADRAARSASADLILEPLKEYNRKLQQGPGYAGEAYADFLIALMGFKRGLDDFGPRPKITPAKRDAYLDSKGVGGLALAEKIALQTQHRTLLNLLQQGDVPVRPGTVTSQLMGELTVASGREVGLIRVGNQRVLRLGSVDRIDLSDAKRVIAHTHPSGDLRFSGQLGGLDGDIPMFRRYQSKQHSSVLIAPDGSAVRLLRIVCAFD